MIVCDFRGSCQTIFLGSSSRGLRIARKIRPENGLPEVPVFSDSGWFMARVRGFPRIRGTGFLTASRPLLSAVIMTALRCMRAITATTSPFRRRWACGIVLVLSSLSGIVAEASTYADPQDHASFCDCGPRCRRDRCCCKPTSEESHDAGVTEAGDSSASSFAGVNSLCRMTSRCEDPAESKVRPYPRSWFGDPMALRSPRAGCDLSARIVPLPEIWFSPLFAFRLERPPKVRTV